MEKISMETAKIAQSISGDKLYQERARRALPLLVRQAQAHAPIYYSDLSAELGMSNPRNLNYVLGSIGQALQLLAVEWSENVPPIQCLVINKSKGVPGEGIGIWFGNEVFRKLSRKQQRELVQIESQKIFAYRKWQKVLAALGLRPVSVDYSALLTKASIFRGGGESNRHKNLKHFVARHPEAIHLPPTTPNGETEYPLPSGDRLDVLFKDKDDWIAVEVKASLSGLDDIVRGMFQCVKYRAVIEAYQATKLLSQSARAILVLESSLPNDLITLKNILGIEVIENVVP
jgi:hypothetical protein